MKPLMARANQFIRAEKEEARGRENFGLHQGDRPSKKDKKSSRREESDRHKAPSSDRHRAPTSDRHRAPSSNRYKAPSTSAAALVPTSGGGRKSRREATVYKAVNIVFKEPIYKLLSKIKMQPFFKWPQPMKGDPSSWDQNKLCAYHKQNGHKINDDKAFEAHLKNLVKDGHLWDHVKEKGKDSNRPCHRDDDGHDSEPEGIINVIHLAPPPKGSSQARAEAWRASHQKQMMTVELEPTGKKARTERPKIWFSDRDLEGVEPPHNDPLVLTLKLKNFFVQRVLIDPGSSSEILL
ncbi:hypothetical protein AAC387_Pa02g2249 [Persea americana]